MTPFTPDDLERAIEDLSICEFFPREPGTQAAIMRLLAKICPHKEALDWLVDTFTNRVGKWHGPVELRAVLCTRFKPQDGIEAWSQIAGFTGAEAEQKLIDQCKQLKAGGTTPPADDPIVKRLLESAKVIQ